MLPPEWSLSPGTRCVTFPSVTGSVSEFTPNPPFHSPEGNLYKPTRVDSYEGISGILHQHNSMFLVGVFLTDDPATDPAPELLDFTDNEDFTVLAPRIGQTFLIGDGVGRRYEVPEEATRLFLGFADAFDFIGPPGWYGNNGGSLVVTVKEISC